MTNVYHSNDEIKFLLKLKQELGEKFKGCNKIAVKIHFGEPGNKTTFVPSDIKPITNLLKEIGLEYFLFDSPVKYNSPRNTVEGYKKSSLTDAANKETVPNTKTPSIRSQISWYVTDSTKDAGYRRVFGLLEDPLTTAPGRDDDNQVRK